MSTPKFTFKPSRRCVPSSRKAKVRRNQPGTRRLPARYFSLIAENMIPRVQCGPEPIAVPTNSNTPDVVLDVFRIILGTLTFTSESHSVLELKLAIESLLYLIKIIQSMAQTPDDFSDLAERLKHLGLILLCLYQKKESITVSFPWLKNLARELTILSEYILRRIPSDQGQASDSTDLASYLSDHISALDGILTDFTGAITTHPMPRAPQKQTRKRDSQREGMSDSDRRQPSTTPIDICPLRTTFNINLTSITNVDCHNTTFGAITAAAGGNGGQGGAGVGDGGVGGQGGSIYIGMNQ